MSWVTWRSFKILGNLNIYQTAEAINFKYGAQLALNEQYAEMQNLV